MIEAQHFYVYVHKDGRTIYERTCGTEEAAKRRVKEFESRGQESSYTTEPIKDAYY